MKNLGNLFDITSRGTLIGCSKANPSVVMEFDINKHLIQNDIRLEEDKYEKQVNFLSINQGKVV